MARRSMLERLVEERVGHTFVGTVSVAVERIAEDIARHALADETFRRTLRALVRERSQAVLDRLLSAGGRRPPGRSRRRPRRSR